MALDELKLLIKELPISKVIGHYLSLSRRGTQTLALCPFHDDSSPSLNVNDKKGMFMCFACNTGGDHITFVEKYKNLNFKEALEEISKIAGVDFNDYNKKANQNPEFEMAQKILQKSVYLYEKIRENYIFEAFK